MAEKKKVASQKNLEDQLKRALADYDNLKKRTEKERTQVVQFANEALLLNLVGVIEGLEISLRQFRSILEQAGFEEIQVTEGDKFDGKIMEAMDGKGDKVEQVLSIGYKLHDKVVKPARVRVKKET